MLNQTDTGLSHMIPIGMNQAVVDYFKSHGIRVMLSIGGIKGRRGLFRWVLGPRGGDPSSDRLPLCSSRGAKLVEHWFDGGGRLLARDLGLEPAEQMNVSCVLHGLAAMEDLVG